MKKNLIISGIIASSLSIGTAISIANSSEPSQEAREQLDVTQLSLTGKKEWSEPKLITLSANESASQDRSILNAS
ncbi:hypothetical protein AB6A23_02830 [Paenibacillus tarimensis]